MSEKPKAKNFLNAWCEAVLAPGLSSKFAALLVVLGTAGALAVLVVAAKRGVVIWRNRPEALSRAAREQKQLTEFIQRQAEESKEKFSGIDLGQFTVAVRPASGDGPKPQGTMDMAELKISLRCEDRDTREFIETHPILVRNAVTSVFTQLDRDDFLTAEGKNGLKHRVLDKINDWLQEEHVSGRVQDVYFPSLVVN